MGKIIMRYISLGITVIAALFASPNSVVDGR